MYLQSDTYFLLKTQACLQYITQACSNIAEWEIRVTHDESLASWILLIYNRTCFYISNRIITLETCIPGANINCCKPQNLCTRWRWVVNFTLRPTYPRRRNPQYLDRGLGGPHSRGDKEKYLPLRGIETRFSSPKPVTLRTADMPQTFKIVFPVWYFIPICFLLETKLITTASSPTELLHWPVASLLMYWSLFLLYKTPSSHHGSKSPSSSVSLLQRKL
jgi:hypothetical protein